MKTILVAEDHEAVRKFITATLLPTNFDVVPVGDGKEALEVLPLAKIDLLITDLQMPNIAGINLIKTVRENPKYQKLPIIILSGLDNSEIQNAMTAGANSYLRKPFNATQLQSEISKYLQPIG